MSSRDLPQPVPGRVAVVDCGTNSIRLLVAERGPAGGLVDVHRRLEIVRLGQGVDATGAFHPEALARTFSAVDRYAEVIQAAGVPLSRTRFVATSAARDAGNRTEFFDGIRQRLGVPADVISGDTEARLSFSGALSGLRPVAEPVLVMDIGGGSTELVLGDAHGEVGQAVSLDVGSVRLTERFLPGSPPAADDLQQASDHVDRLLVGSGIDLSTVGSWFGVAGTVTTLASVQLGLPGDDLHALHGAVLRPVDLRALLSRLSGLSAAQIRTISTMHPQRADVITAGALIATRVAAAVPATELVVSATDILDGLALELLGS